MSTTTTRISAPPVVGWARDPFIDLLRVGATVTVVVGHWILPVLAWHHGRLTAGSSLATPGWWVLTWFAQAMPVFFFAGGAANYHSYTAVLRRGGDARAWLTGRVRRLVVPVVPMLAIWLVLPAVLIDLGVPRQPVALGGGVVGQLLWFLAVYLLAVAATPLMHAAAGRWGLAVPVVLGLGAFGVDALRFHGLPVVGYLNELLVWLAIQQLGIGYAAGQLGRRGAAAMGVAGFGATVLLVVFGPYPASMVGMPGQALSNMAPVTCCLLTLGVGQIGVLLALRERLVRWTGSWRLLPVLGKNCMTVYLWHMPTMVVVAGIAVLGFGYATPVPGSAGWLAVTPLWIAALALVLVVLVRTFGRFERVRAVDRVPSTRCLVLAVVLVCAGLIGIVSYGFAEPLLTLPWVAAVLVGLGLTWPGVGGRTGTRLLGTLIDATFGRPRRR